MDRCIWNWVAVALEIEVMASVGAVPHTMLQPGNWHSWQSRAELVLHILPRGLGGPGRGTSGCGSVCRVAVCTSSVPWLRWGHLGKTCRIYKCREVTVGLSHIRSSTAACAGGIQRVVVVAAEGGL